MLYRESMVELAKVAIAALQLPEPYEQEETKKQAAQFLSYIFMSAQAWTQS